jgi:hypothetical protein
MSAVAQPVFPLASASSLQVHVSSYEMWTLRASRRAEAVECVTSEAFTAVAMKNAVFWDVNTQFYLTGDTLRLRYRTHPVNAM